MEKPNSAVDMPGQLNLASSIPAIFSANMSLLQEHSPFSVRLWMESLQFLFLSDGYVQDALGY